MNVFFIAELTQICHSISAGYDATLLQWLLYVEGPIFAGILQKLRLLSWPVYTQHE